MIHGAGGGNIYAAPSVTMAGFNGLGPDSHNASSSSLNMGMGVGAINQRTEHSARSSGFGPGAGSKGLHSGTGRSNLGGTGVEGGGGGSARVATGGGKRKGVSSANLIERAVDEEVDLAILSRKEVQPTKWAALEVVTKANTTPSGGLIYFRVIFFFIFFYFLVFFFYRDHARSLWTE